VETIGGIPVLAVCESPFYGADGLIKAPATSFSRLSY